MTVTTPPQASGHSGTPTIDGRAAWRTADTVTGNGVLTGIRVLDLSRVGERIAGFSRADLGRRLEEAGVPASPVHTVDEALKSAQARHRGLFIDDEDYRGLGVPITLGRSPRRRPRPAVPLGADTTAVLTAMGYHTDRIEELREAGIFGNP